MAESNYLSSDLSDPKYTYDLVVGTTAQAINANMKMYLARNASTSTEVWYGQETAGAPLLPMSPIAGVDPFSIPDGGTPPAAITDSKFQFAIKAGFGLPQGVNPLSVPDILILGNDRQKVTYQLFFNTFRIVTLEWGARGSSSWKNFAQPDGSPIVFKFLVDLNFNKADPEAKFTSLPAETRTRLKSLNTNSMFSVQHLYLDLNNAGLQSMPSIGGFPADSPVLATLQRNFINTYWRDIAENGKFILGYAVKANVAPRDSRASIQPTDLNFSVVPHHDMNGNPTSNNSLYTLNYLMNCENRRLTLGGNFPWNWVSKSEAATYQGAMAVRREVFANFLNDSLSQSLGYICIEPTVHYEQRNAGFSWSASYGLHFDTSPGKFTYVPAAGATVLNLSYSKSAYQTDKSGLIRGHFGLTSNATGIVSVSGNEMSVKLAANMQMNFDNGDLGAGSANGRAGGYESEAIYVMTVDGAGRITVSMKPGFPKTRNLGSSIDEGFLAGLDGVNGITGKLSNSYNQMAQGLASYTSSVQSFLNSTGNQWVFPGGQVLIFKDVAFSNYQDLVTHLSYADGISAAVSNTHRSSLSRHRIWAIQENGIWTRWAPEFSRWDIYSEHKDFIFADPTTGEACYFVEPDGRVGWRNVDRNQNRSFPGISASSVSVGGQGRIWAIQKNGIWARWAPEYSRWDVYSEPKKFIVADPTTGQACYFVEPDGSVGWRNVDQNRNKTFPGISATSISVGGDSRLWAIQTNGVWARWAPERNRWDTYSERKESIFADSTTGQACYFVEPGGRAGWRNVDQNQNESFPGIASRQISVGGLG